MSTHTELSEDRDTSRKQHYEQQHAPRPVPPTRPPVQPEPRPCNPEAQDQEPVISGCLQADRPPGQTHREVPASLAASETSGLEPAPSVLPSDDCDPPWPLSPGWGQGPGGFQWRQRQGQPQQGDTEPAEERDCCEGDRRAVRSEATSLRPQHQKARDAQGQGRVGPESVRAQTDVLLPVRLSPKSPFLIDGAARTVAEGEPASSVRHTGHASALDAQSEPPGSRSDLSSHGRKGSPEKAPRGGAAAFPCFWVDSSPLSQSILVSPSASLPDAGNMPKRQPSLPSRVAATAFTSDGEQSSPASTEGHHVFTRSREERGPFTISSRQNTSADGPERKLPVIKILASPIAGGRNEDKGRRKHRGFPGNVREEFKVHVVNRNSGLSDKEEGFNDGGGEKNGTGKRRGQLISVDEDEEKQRLESSGPRQLRDTSLKTCSNPIKQEGRLTPDKNASPSTLRQVPTSIGEEESKFLAGKSFESSVGKETKPVIREGPQIMSKEFIFREEPEIVSAKSFIRERGGIKTQQKAEFFRDGSDVRVKKDPDSASDCNRLAGENSDTSKSERHGAIPPTHRWRREEGGGKGGNESGPASSQFRAYPWLCPAPAPHPAETDPEKDNDPLLPDSHSEQNRPVSSASESTHLQQGGSILPSAARRHSWFQWSAQTQVVPLQSNIDTGHGASVKGKKSDPSDTASQKYPATTNTADEEEQRFPRQALPTASRRTPEKEQKSILCFRSQGSPTDRNATSGNRFGNAEPVVRADTAARGDKEREEARDNMRQTPPYHFSTQINESSATFRASNTRTARVRSEFSKETGEGVSQPAEGGLGETAQSSSSDGSTSHATSSRGRKRQRKDINRDDRERRQGKERQKDRVRGREKEDGENEAADTHTDGRQTRGNKRRRGTGKQLSTVPESSGSSECVSHKGGDATSFLGIADENTADGIVDTLNTDVQWRILFETSLPVTQEMTDVSVPQRNAVQENIDRTCSLTYPGAEVNRCGNHMTIKQEFEEGVEQKDPNENNEVKNSPSSQSFQVALSFEEPPPVKVAVNGCPIGDDETNSSVQNVIASLQPPNPERGRSRRKQKVPRQVQHRQAPKWADVFPNERLTADFSQHQHDANTENWSRDSSSCGSGGNSTQSGKSPGRFAHTVPRPRCLENSHEKVNRITFTHKPPPATGLDCPAQKTRSGKDAAESRKHHGSIYSQTTGLDLTVSQTKKSEQHDTAGHSQASVSVETFPEATEESLFSAISGSNSRAHQTEKSNALFRVHQNSEPYKRVTELPPLKRVITSSIGTITNAQISCRLKTTTQRDMTLEANHLRNRAGRMTAFASVEDHPLLQCRPRVVSLRETPKNSVGYTTSLISHISPADIALPKRTSSAKATYGRSSTSPSKSQFPTGHNEFPLTTTSRQMTHADPSPMHGRGKEHSLASVLPCLQLHLSHLRSVTEPEMGNKHSLIGKSSFSQESALDLRLNQSRKDLESSTLQCTDAVDADLKHRQAVRTNLRAIAERNISEKRQAAFELCPGKLSKSVQDVMALTKRKVNKNPQRSHKLKRLQPIRTKTPPHLVLTPVPPHSEPSKETSQKKEKVAFSSRREGNVHTVTHGNLGLNDAILSVLDTKATTENGSLCEQLTKSCTSVSQITFMMKDDPKQSPHRMSEGRKSSARRTAKDSKIKPEGSGIALTEIEESSTSAVLSPSVSLTPLALTQGPSTLVPVKPDPDSFRTTSPTLASSIPITSETVQPTTVKATPVTATTVPATPVPILGLPYLPVPLYSPTCGLGGISSPMYGGVRSQPPLFPLISSSASSDDHIQQSRMIPVFPFVVPSLQAPVTEEQDRSARITSFVRPHCATASLASGNQALSSGYAAISRFFSGMSLHTGQEHEVLAPTAMPQAGNPQIEMSQIGLVSSEVLTGNGGSIPVIFLLPNSGQDLSPAPIRLEQTAVSVTTTTPSVATSALNAVQQEGETPQTVNTKPAEDGSAQRSNQSHSESAQEEKCLRNIEPVVQTGSSAQTEVTWSPTQAKNGTNSQFSTVECKEERIDDNVKPLVSLELEEENSAKIAGTVSNGSQGVMLTTPVKHENDSFHSRPPEMKEEETKEEAAAGADEASPTTNPVKPEAEITALNSWENLKPSKAGEDGKLVVTEEIPTTQEIPVSPTPLLKSGRKRTALTRFSFQTDFDFSDVSDSGDVTTPATSDDDWTPDEYDVGQEAMSSDEEDPLKKPRPRACRKDALHEMFTPKKRPAARATRHRGQKGRQKRRRSPTDEGLTSGKDVICNGHLTQSEKEKTPETKVPDNPDCVLGSLTEDVSDAARDIVVKQMDWKDKQLFLNKLLHQPDGAVTGSEEVIKGGQVPGKATTDHISSRKRRGSGKRRKTPYTVEDLSCRLCGKTFVNIYRLKRHESSHGNERPFVCDVCGKAFKQSGHRNEHRLTHNSIKRSFLCNVCGVVIGSRSSFRYHIMSHKQLVDGTVDTAACEITTHKLDDSQTGGPLPMNQMTSMGMAAYDCPHCEERFATAQSLNCHLETHLEVEVRCHVQPFSCAQCGRSFTYRHNLEKHRECHVSSETRAHNYQRKVQAAIASGKPHFVCDTCGKVYLRKETLSKHLKTHLGLKPFQCGVCLKSFTQKVHLTVHSRLHTGSRPFQCRKCRCCFLDSTALARHVERDVCNSDREGFGFNVGKRGRKPFPGQDASVKAGVKRKKGGSRKGNRKGSKSFRCGLCGWSGKHRGFLTRHISRCHPYQTNQDSALLDSKAKTSSETNGASSKRTEAAIKPKEATPSLNGTSSDAGSPKKTGSLATSPTSKPTSMLSSAPCL